MGIAEYALLGLALYLFWGDPGPEALMAALFAIFALSGYLWVTVLA